MRVRRENFRQPKNFSIHDIKYEITAETKSDGDGPLVLSSLGGLTHAIDSVLDSLRNFYGTANHKFLIVFHHKDIFNRGVRLREYNLQTSNSREIIHDFTAALENLLESHQHMKIDKTLKIYITVYGKELARDRAEKKALANIPTAGRDENWTQPPGTRSIWTGFESEDPNTKNNFCTHLLLLFSPLLPR